jgi:hypothetical protein
VMSGSDWQEKFTGLMQEATDAQGDKSNFK